MKKLIFICGMLVSSLSFSADWVYITSTRTESFWINKQTYKYNFKNDTVDVWNRSIKSNTDGKNVYVRSKSFDRYSCTNKSYKNLAYIEYNDDGTVLKSYSTPAKDFSIIFPDSIAEGLWEASCKSKGRGFKFTKSQLETISLFDLQQKYGEGIEYAPELVPDNLINK